jgi:hypothetical protein
MAVDTYIEQASARVRTEREAIEELVDAYGTFIRRVRELQPDGTPASMAGTTTAGGAIHVSGEASGPERCRRVRTAFAETVRPHSVADIDEPEPVLETIREEFTDAVAVALAPTTDTAFTPELKGMVLSEARSRRSEAAALQRALGREATELDDVAEAVEDVVTWIVEADETPLSDLGFDALKQRHETLADHRDRCESLARDRQEFLRGTTTDGLETRVSHRSLVAYLYSDFPVDHPVLATVTTLDETCRDCQRAVRTHLVRRA